MIQICKKYDEAMKQLIEIRDDLESKKISQSELGEKINRLKEEMENLQDDYNQLKIKVNQLKNEMLRELQRSNFSSPNINEDEMISMTILQLEEKLAELQTRAALISNVDLTILDMYESREQSIRDLEVQISRNEQSINLNSIKISEASSKWLDQVNSFISRIDENFAKFFLNFGCAGKVLLIQPNDKLQFDQYGIDIKVQFRNNSTLKSLGIGFQSGGERSVSTMLYLLSLQFCVSFPFRIVDELNQGMDEINERLIMEIVVKTVSSFNSQYFLITPKLINNLKYSNENVGVMVLCRSTNMNVDCCELKL